MKIISLNIGIKINNTNKIIDFLKTENADIVCLQEVAKHEENSVLPLFKAKSKIDKTLKHIYPFNFFGDVFESRGYNATGRVEMDFGGLIKQGNYILSKLPLIEANNIFYYMHYRHMYDWTKWLDEDTGRPLQQVIIDLEQAKKLQVINLHGIWTRDKKGDRRTIKQSQSIVKIASKYINLPTIVLGDINLLPNTKSITILNQNFTNLIEKYNIKTSRPDFEDSIDKGNNVVDYVFVNNKVQVKNFNIPSTEISDHLPLVLDFNI